MVYIAIYCVGIRRMVNFMEKIKIDKNAHIIDIESSVIQEEEQLCIKLSFTNITPLYNFINNIPDAESVVLKP